MVQGDAAHTYHDIVSKTLSQITAAAVSPERDRSEQHLRPADDGVGLADNAVQADSPRTDSLFMYMQLEVDAEGELEEDGREEDVGEGAVDACEESAAAVRVPKNVTS